MTLSSDHPNGDNSPAAADGGLSSAGGSDVRVTRALTRYRIMAWVTGVMLLVLVGVAMPLK
jgi:hypothetical protein